MTDRPVRQAIDNLRLARGPDNPLERAELRDEVRVMALLLMAQELETIANAMQTTLTGLDTVLSTLTNTDQLTIHDLERQANGNGPGARPPGPSGEEDA